MSVAILPVLNQTLTLASPEETEALAHRLSLWARPGLLVALQGDLGAGKSTFARAFIRSLFRDGEGSDIPSPSFSLVQAYDETRLPVFHADLYRIQSASEVAELGLGEMLATSCGLVEWADRLPHVLGPDTLSIKLSGRGQTRLAEIEARGAWISAVTRDSAICSFLADIGRGQDTRLFFEGDASSRRYEEIVAGDGSRVLLMDMPTRPDGPPVRHGKPYSAVAHLAEGLTAVVAINTHLVRLGYSAPRILEHDLKQGLALIEPLGDEVFGKMIARGADMREPMGEAIAVLADMATKDWPGAPEASPGVSHQVMRYDIEAQLIEVDLLPEWFHQHVHGAPAPVGLGADFEMVWRGLLPLAEALNPQWVMRDYHSPNLIWMAERQGLKRVGLIDTQDAVMGHPAYDVVSMTQDARTDIDFAVADQLVAHYCDLRRKRAGPFNEADFRTALAVLGAQRATKILGIFARLNKRDGKPGYLKHMPRVSRYLARNLDHPALAPLKRWYEMNMPVALSAGARGARA